MTRWQFGHRRSPSPVNEVFNGWKSSNKSWAFYEEKSVPIPQSQVGLSSFDLSSSVQVTENLGKTCPKCPCDSLQRRKGAILFSLQWLGAQQSHPSLTGFSAEPLRRQDVFPRHLKESAVSWPSGFMLIGEFASKIFALSFMPFPMFATFLSMARVRA